jgi:hypothetical protein
VAAGSAEGLRPGGSLALSFRARGRLQLAPYFLHGIAIICPTKERRPRPPAQLLEALPADRPCRLGFALSPKVEVPNVLTVTPNEIAIFASFYADAGASEARLAFLDGANKDFGGWHFALPFFAADVFFFFIKLDWPEEM